MLKEWRNYYKIFIYCVVLKFDSLWHLQLYHNFVADFEHRINPLALMEICVFVTKQIKGMLLYGMCSTNLNQVIYS